MKTGQSTRRVVFVAYDGFQSLDLAGPFEAFAGLNELLDAGKGAGLRYTPEVAALRAGPIRSESGLTITADTALAHIRGPLDTLVVVGGRAASQAQPDTALIHQIQRLARRTERVTSVCTGSFLLAEAGLLDGRIVCTHWARAKLFAERFPNITLDGDSLHRRDGNVWTSAGVTAGIDLALALIADDHGSDLAQVVSRWLVMFYRRPGGQSQFLAENFGYKIRYNRAEEPGPEVNSGIMERRIARLGGAQCRRHRRRARQDRGAGVDHSPAPELPDHRGGASAHHREHQGEGAAAGHAARAARGVIRPGW